MVYDGLCSAAVTVSSIAPLHLTGKYATHVSQNIHINNYILGGINVGRWQLFRYLSVVGMYTSKNELV